jgi:hypothetical protein
MLTKEHALKIKKKLKAKEIRDKRNRPHDLYGVYYNDVLIASFGIRRGSNKHLPHDHIPEDLYLKPNECLRFAQCQITLKQWIKMMKNIGIIEQDTAAS